MEKDFKDLTTNEKLNKILDVLCVKTDFNVPKMAAHFYREQLGMEPTRMIIKEMVLFLAEDGFVIRQENTTEDQGIYNITFKGRKFSENGGYVAKSLREDAERKRNEAEADRLKRVDDMSYQNQTRLNDLTDKLVWGTWLASLIALCLLLIELGKLCFPCIFEHSRHFHN
jgi:hypothetical protein